MGKAIAKLNCFPGPPLGYCRRGMQFDDVDPTASYAVHFQFLDPKEQAIANNTQIAVNDDMLQRSRNNRTQKLEQIQQVMQDMQQEATELKSEESMLNRVPDNPTDAQLELEKNRLIAENQKLRDKKKEK
jgi:hypothetical protein